VTRLAAIASVVAAVVLPPHACGTREPHEPRASEVAPASSEATRVEDVPTPGSPASTMPTRCEVGQGTGAASAWRLVDAFPALPDLAQPIDLVGRRVGRGDRIYVAERAGRVVSFDPADPAALETLVDLRAKVHDDFECGLLGLVLHPDFANNGTFFLDYCTRRRGVTRSIISRWRTRAGSPPLEEELLSVVQPFDNHNGGSLAFGPDGRLYIGFGDGGGSNDPSGHGQDPSTLLGAILRLDVDTGATADRPYGIPPDNPFASGVGGRPEIYAWGLRNPWRMSFDRLTGELWVGDVGQNAREEIDVVARGDNHGWKIMEGTICRPGGPRACAREGLALPVLDYPHDQGRSVTGGFVYRGSRLPALVGRYVYTDFVTRALWAWRRGDPPPAAPLLTTSAMIASFGEDAHGELYALGLDTGRIYRLEEDPRGVASPPPRRLSETGCFTSLQPLTPAPALVAYDVALPFWSDGADKGRWLLLPEGAQAEPPSRSDAPWRFPAGSVFVKHFDQSGAPLETRFLVQHDDGVRGFTYRWDADGRDARLLAGMADTDAWHFPSPAECVTCHVGRGPLGLTPAQLGAAPVAWAERGLVAGARVPTAAPHPRLDDQAAPVEARARAWLEVNCAYCHGGPNGPSGTSMDLRAQTPLSAMGLCGVPAQREDLGDPAMRRVVPGVRGKSLVHARAARRDVLAMPPLATRRVDAAGLDLVGRWIDGLAACP